MLREVSLDEISDGRLYEANDMVKADCGDCRGCSACCYSMGSSIVLDPLDVYRLCDGLKLEFSQLLAGYLELNVVDGIILPNLKMEGEEERCLFLNQEGRCTIHGFRPGICRLFPLGRYYEGDSFKYFLQVRECRNQNRTKVKVKKWIDTPQLPRYEQYIRDWHYFLKDLEELILKAGEQEKTLKQSGFSEQKAKEISMSLLGRFYVTPFLPVYDFYEQFYSRLQEAKHTFGLE